jgi:hypothetical protein
MSSQEPAGGCALGASSANGARVCVVCGYDLLGEAERPPPESVSFPIEWRTDLRWEAVIGIDEARYRRVTLTSPPETSTPRLQSLTGGPVVIGRRRAGHATPDIDLGVEPADKAVSHRHALLVARPGGGFVLKDLASTNGTRINGGARPLPPYMGVEISDGDRIALGQWTTITVRRSAAGAAGEESGSQPE